MADAAREYLSIQAQLVAQMRDFVQDADIPPGSQWRVSITAPRPLSGEEETALKGITRDACDRLSERAAYCEIDLELRYSSVPGGYSAGPRVSYPKRRNPWPLDESLKVFNGVQKDPPGEILLPDQEWVFQKVYNCPSLDATESLEKLFLKQRELILMVNENLKEVNKSQSGVARPAILETTLFRGTPVPASELATCQTASAIGLPEYRLFVQCELLRKLDPKGYSLDKLSRFLPLARSLDELHRRGAFHGDLKLTNVCLGRSEVPDKPVANSWAVIVDTESLCQPHSCDLFYTGLHTSKYLHPYYATALGDQKRLNADKLLEAGIASDRYAFALVISEVFLDGASRALTTQERAKKIREALGPVENEGKIGALCECWSSPFIDPGLRDLARFDQWSCASWLTALIDRVCEIREPRTNVSPEDERFTNQVLDELRLSYNRAVASERNEALNKSLKSLLERKVKLASKRLIRRRGTPVLALQLLLFGVACIVLFF